LRDLLGNGELRDLVGGLRQATLGDDNPRYKVGKRKTVSERAAAPVFAVLVEIRSPSCVVIHHDLARAVDNLLDKIVPIVEQRMLDEYGNMFVRRKEM